MSSDGMTKAREQLKVFLVTSASFNALFAGASKTEGS